MQNRRYLAVVALVCFLFAGCSRPSDPQAHADWRRLVSELGDLDRIARLDVPATQITTSYDPTGGNDDFNRYIRPGPKGWWVIADLQGPGHVSRFWNTGAPSNHPIRLYFDNEKKPRVDDTIVNFFQFNSILPLPVSAHEQGCKYSYGPIPFEKRLVVMAGECGTKPGNWPRLFFQINYATMPPGQTIHSYDPRWSQEDRQAVESVRALWTGEKAPVPDDVSPSITATLRLEPGQTAVMERIPGPKLVRRLEIEPDLSAVTSAVMRERLMRDIVLRAFWDGSPDPSVEVPMGEFFGSFQRRIRYDSLFLGMKGSSFHTRFRMPFRSEARFSFENQGQVGIGVTVRIWTDEIPAPEAAWGYFHACWNRTGPQDVGKPHPVLLTRGRGRLAGCMLDAMSLDNSWWLLEGDESIRIDGASMPQWLGTGLEDYFNGGWYYFNIMARPLSGLLFKSPFRTLQYRYHLPDAVLFNSSLEMVFERGPQQASRGWMESVAYYYLEKPQAAAFRIGAASLRQPQADPFGENTLLGCVINSERLGDFQGAADRVREFLETSPASQFADVLKLRLLNYREMAGDTNVIGEYAQIALSGDKKAAHVQQAGLLAWFHEKPDNALLGMFCNGRTTVAVDGQRIAQVDHPEQLVVAPVVLAPGRHVLSASTVWARQDPWVQVCLRTHQGDVTSGIGWRRSRAPAGDWQKPGYDDSTWELVDRVTRDLPQEPYIRTIPNAFVGMQSSPGGMNAAEWNEKRDTVYFRKEFDIR